MRKIHRRMQIAVHDNGLVSSHAETIAEAIEGTIIKTGQRIANSDVVLFPFPHPNSEKDIAWYKDAGVLTISYWLGSDAYVARKDFTYLKAIKNVDLHLFCHDRLKEEMGQVGVEGQVLYLFSRPPYEAKKDEEREKAISIYIPHVGHKYFIQEAKEIIAACPAYSFLIYGGAPLGELPKNAENLGRIAKSMVDSMMARTLGTIRLTRHDGFPIQIIEAKKQRRNVIATYPYFGCESVQNQAQAIELIKGGLFGRPDTSDAPDWHLKHCTAFAFKTELERIIAKHANLPC